MCLLHWLTRSSPLQVQASLGVIHKAIDLAISLNDHQAGHDTANNRAEEAQETTTTDSQMALGPQPPVCTTADLVFEQY